MSVLLIRPPQNRFRPSFLSSQSPLNLMYLAAALKKAGAPTRILDFESVVFSREFLLKRLREIRPQLVGITAFTCTVSGAAHLADIVKEESDGITTVLGGIHASALPKESLDEFKSFDYVWTGEGETHFPEFCRKVLGGNGAALVNTPGLGFRRPDGGVTINPPELLEDLDSIPFPDRSEEFEAGAGIKGLKTRSEMRYAEIMTSRGCPFNCAFCAVSVIHKRTRMRGVGNVMAEIAGLKDESGVTHLDIVDSTFTVNRKRLIEISGEIGKLGLTYNCNAVLSTVDHEVMKLMRETGCRKISFGVESGSPEILRRISKKVRPEEILGKVADARRAGIPVIECSYIIGLHPDETEEDIRLTEEVMLKADADVSVVSVGIPLPGTRMYEEFNAAGLLEDWGNWDSYSFFGAAPRTRTRHVSNARLLALQKGMLRRYYFSPRRILKQLGKVSSPGQLLNSLKAAFSLLAGSKKG